jgi:predicted Fe-Mo cluster-binding NifX family protein
MIKMKIAFPIKTNEGLEGQLADHFGRAPKFAIYETERKKFQLIENTGDHFGGRTSTPMLLSKNDVNVLICKGLGRRAIERLSKNGIEIFITTHQNVKDALKSYFLGELPIASETDACAGSHNH